MQDPNDVCCEMQVCDVSQDVHEEPPENISNSTLTSSTTSEVNSYINEIKISKNFIFIYHVVRKIVSYVKLNSTFCSFLKVKQTLMLITCLKQ